MIKLNAQQSPKPADRTEKDIVQILAKVKAKVVRERIRVLEFLEQYDRYKHDVISRTNFRRGLENCRLGLTENETETLMEV